MGGINFFNFNSMWNPNGETKFTELSMNDNTLVAG